MNIFKRALSLLLAVVLMVCSFQITDITALAEIKEGIQQTLASVTNAVNRISLTAEQTQCTHNYEFYQIKNGNPTCTSSGNVIYKCTLCGATETRRTSLGHYYVYESDLDGVLSYRCSFCGVTATADVYGLYEIFQENINHKALRGYDNRLLDIVNDGFINAKDFCALRQAEGRIIPTTLTNKKSNAKTKQIYRYLCAMHGQKTISAQQESTWMGSPDYEVNYIYNNTGRYPAMRGLDYMNDDFYGVNQRAIQWWNRGGLVTICWHTGSDFTGEWNDAMNDTVSDWTAMLTEGTSEYNAMISGMDKAAQALKQLQDNGVTVLWRPFHEPDGKWFWWGKGNATNFKKMWKIMYDRYTNYWGLNNLIWVIGFSHNGNVRSWNPGTDYFDIVGCDTYDPSEFSTLYSALRTNYGTLGKPMVLHECGTNPTVAQLNSYPYGYFMTWHTTYLTSDNQVSALNALYNDDRVITLDELDYESY